MSQHYFVLLTKVGQAQLSNAIALGRKLNVSYVQLGDGGADEGKETHPTENDTQLKRTRGQVPVNAVFQHESNPHWVVFQVVIPDDVGGFYITELGLFDDNDNLIAVGKYPKTYKATLPDGISTSMDLDVICQVGNADNVELKIDPSKVLATVDYMDKAFNDHIQSANPHPQYAQQHQLNQHQTAADPHAQYLLKTAFEPSLAPLFAHSFDKTGYQKLPSGLLMQWGTTQQTLHADEYETVIYPVPFTTAVFFCAGHMVRDSISDRSSTAEVAGVTLTHMTLKNELFIDVYRDNSRGPITWFALGI